MRTVMVHDAKTGPQRRHRHKLCPRKGPLWHAGLFFGAGTGMGA
jgi:hypothetical protein